jgi:fatty-acyl-CoA synthase
MKELMKQTVGDLLDEMAERYPDHEAVVYGDFPFRKTYSQFRDTCNQVAKGLMAMGVKKVIMWPCGQQTIQNGLFPFLPLPK